MLTYIDIMYWLLAIGLILKCAIMLVKTTQYKSSGISSANLLRALEIFDLPPAISPELNKCPGSNPVSNIWKLLVLILFDTERTKTYI